MALSLDQYKKIASDTHPDWSQQQIESWAQEKVGNSQTKEKSSSNNVLDKLGDRGHKAGAKISGWFDDLISDETASKNTLARVADMGLNVVGGVIGGATEAVAQTPRFVKDVVSMPFTDKSEWGWSDVKNRAKELQDDYGMNRAGAWLTAIDENNDSEHTSAQTVFQLLNNPLLFKGVGKALDVVGSTIKGGSTIAKGAKVIGKVENVADDAAKVSKGAKVAGAAEEVIEDTTKTAGRSNILTKIKNGVDTTKKYINETPIGQKVKDFGKSTARFLGGPITDVYDIAKVGINATKTAMKTTGVGSSVMQGLRATLGETVQTAGKFISKPLSYRTPRIWTTSTADLLIGDNLELGYAADDRGDFRREYGYNIDVVGYLDDDELQTYYDQNNIPQDKRLTAEQIREKKSQLGENFVSNFTEGAKNLYQAFDIFSASQTMYKQRENALGSVEVERNARGEFRGFGDGKSINFATGEVKDKDGNTIDIDNLTSDELQEIEIMYDRMQAEGNSPASWSEQTGLKSNNITDTINSWAVNGMITDVAENMVMSSENAGVRANAIYINNQLNEASKEYVNEIISLYTPEEINSNPQLQNEISKSLNAYSLLLNNTAAIISNLDDDEYNDVYRVKKALTAAYNSMDEDSKNLIDNNLYKKAIDYNNNLESGFDQKWMKAATWVKRATDKMLNIFWSDDTNFWYEQGLAGIAGSIVNPELSSWGTARGEISNGLRQNSAYAVDMVVLNKINDSVIEKFVGNKLTDVIRKNPELNGKYLGNTKLPIGKISNGVKGGVTEMFSEFLENFTDAISMVEDANTDYDFVTGLMFGMFQGAMAGYASSTDSYQSFKDYLTRPENRNQVLENMGIYIDAIENPQQKAVMLSIVSQLMDDKSDTNLIDIIVNTASQTTNGVENLMQGYALYQVNKMVGNYTNSIVGQVLDAVNEVEERDEATIQRFFGTSTDPSGMTNFNNYKLGKQFVFNQSIINDIKNIQKNKDEAERIAKTSAAFIKSSFKTAGMSFEEGLNYMAPKINSKGNKIITPIKNTKTVTGEAARDITGDPVKDVVSVYTKTGQIAFTIGDKLGITPNNDKVFGTKKSKFGFKSKPGFKNKIEITDKDGNTNTVSMKEYLVDRLNNANLSDEERHFIGTIMFKTTVSGLNPYFNDDGSLTRLGEDFLKQIVPELEERTSTVDFLNNVMKIQTIKEAQVEQSKNEAMKNSGANMVTNPTLNIKGEAFKDGDDVSNIPDDTELPFEKDGNKAQFKDLKNGGIIVKDGGRLATISITENQKLRIIYDEQIDNQEQPFEEESGLPVKQEDGTILFAEDQRLDALSEEEFQKEYDQAEKDRKEAWRKYYAMEEEINKNPSRSDTARDQRFDTLVRLQREAYKATNKKKRMEESKARREKNTQANLSTDTKNQSTGDFKEDLKNYNEEKDKNKKIDKKAMGQAFVDGKSDEEQYKAGGYVKVGDLYVDPRVSKKVLEKFTPRLLHLMKKAGISVIEYTGEQLHGGEHHVTINGGKAIGKIAINNDMANNSFFEHVLIHEIGHHVYYNLSDEEKAQASKFSKDYTPYIGALREGKNKSGASLGEENFVEGFAIYIALKRYGRSEHDLKLDDLEQHHIELYDRLYNSFNDNDDTTPPPAAPAVQQETAEEEPNEAEQQVQERLNQVWTALPGATGEKVVQDTNPVTQETKYPISVYEHDHQELEGKFVDVKVLLSKWDHLKSYIPYFVRGEQNVEKPINNRFENFSYPDVYKKLGTTELNNPSINKDLPKVTITEKDGTTKTYTLVFIGEGPITDIVGITRKGMMRHSYYRSYALVDFENEEVEIKISNTIRPAYKWNSKLDVSPEKLYFKNNKSINIKRKDGGEIEGNRVLGFTKASVKGIDGKRGPDNWYLSTTLQIERLGEKDQDRAFKNKRVFMNAPSNDSTREGLLFNRETRSVEKVKYDGRPIFTTSDIVFNDNNESIQIGDININIADRSYSNGIPLRGQNNSLEETTLQDWFNMLWDKGQTISADGTSVEDIPNKKKISNINKEFKEIVKTQNDNVDMVLEIAENTPAVATESIEETILKNTESFKAGGIQESLFGGQSLDSVKSSVEDRINKIIKISLNEDDINDRIEDIEKDIEDLENEDNSDQEDIDSLNAEKNELVDQLETLSTFQKIVDESEDFDTIEQYLDSELNRLKEGDTNTIMDMASQYGILESDNTDFSSIPWEESPAQEEAVTEEESETATTEPEENQTTFTESAGSYQQRTKENAANSDATIAFAYDFNTAGERLTKSAAGDKYNSVNIKNLSYQTLMDKMYEIANKLPNDSDLTINIAGNGIYTLSANSDYNQEYYNKLLQEAISMLLSVRPNIKTIISGGQTGIDEAGIIAGQRLGLKTIVNAPKGWKFRDASGKDISDENKFKSRFGTEVSSTDNTTTSYDYEGEQEYLSSIQDNPYGAEMPIRELPIKENSKYEVQENNFDAKKIWNEGKIPAVRRDIDGNPNHSFGNPFDGWTKTVKVKDEKTGKIVSKAEYGVAEATRRFYKWLRGTDYQNVKPEQRKWIVDQIKNGSLRGKTVVYYTEDVPNKYKGNDVNDYGVSKYDDKHPNHAMVLQKFINGEYTIVEPSTSTDAVMVSEGTLVSDLQEEQPLALSGPKNGINLTAQEIDSIKYKLQMYSREFDSTRDMPIGSYERLNDDGSLQLTHSKYGYYIIKTTGVPGGERVTYAFNKPQGILDYIAGENIINNIEVDAVPEISDLLEKEYPSNKTIGENLLTDPRQLAQMLQDCKDLGIVLGALDGRTLGNVILAYTRNGRGIDQVLEDFANKMPGSFVDQKLLDIMINKGILQRSSKYGNLTLSQIIAYNYGLKKIRKDEINNVVNKVISRTGYNGNIAGLKQEQVPDLLNVITDYYIENYLNLNPESFGVESAFRRKMTGIVHKKLIDSEIFIHKKGQDDVLSQKENPDLLLQLQAIKPELRRTFVEAAYNNRFYDEKSGEWKKIADDKTFTAPLITLSQYNYLMESDPFLTVVGSDEEYNVGPIASTVLQSINEITEIGEITDEDANRSKLQILYDVYSYYEGSRKASYEGLVTFLKRKYRYNELSNDSSLKKIISIIDEDAKLSLTPMHSEGVMMSLRTNAMQKYDNDPYEYFKANETNGQSIEDALIVLERQDSYSFQQIIAYAPKTMRDNLYNRFQAENKEQKSSNIAYRMVSGLITNNLKVANDLKQEADSDLPKVEGAVYDMLKHFNPMSLVNAATTKILYQRFGISGLDLSKGTVVLTNNRQDSLGKRMQNFRNTDRFPLLPVASLNEIEADVNVIVPYGVSIPADTKYNYNIIKLDNAGYHDGALVVSNLGNRVVDFSDRMYNIFGLYGLGVRSVDGFELTAEQKELIKNNKNQPNLYWNIFQNNILPNLSEEAQNITQEEFEQEITKSGIDRVTLKTLYKCFAAGDIQEMIDNSIVVINAATRGKFKLKSNNNSGRLTVNTTKAVNEFAEFLSEQNLSNKAKERIARAFGDFMMAQMQIGKINIAEWWQTFRDVHSQALSELYNIPEIKEQQVEGIEVFQMFLNNNLTEKVETNQNVDISELINSNSIFNDPRLKIVESGERTENGNLLQRIAKRRARLDELATQRRSGRRSSGRSVTAVDFYSEEEKRLLAEIAELEKQLKNEKGANVDNIDVLEIVNRTSGYTIDEADGVTEMQDEEGAKNSMVMSNAAEDNNRLYNDKAEKVLEVLFDKFISKNTVTVEAGQSSNNENHIVSEGLLSMITGENTFTNTFGEVTVGNERNKYYAYTQNNLHQLVGILSTLKKTNPKRFKQLLDDIFRTYDNIGYTYDTPVHKKLIRAKEAVANNPAELLNIFGEVTKDPSYSTEFMEGGEFEKKLNFKDVNMDGLLQSASKEYFEGSPYVVRTAEGVENMNMKIKQYHELYDKYFDKLLPDGVMPSDEQIKGFAKLKDTFDKRKESGKWTSKKKVFSIPGIAGAGKTTMLTAFFKYVNEVGGAEYEVDNIANGKQTSLIYNFDFKEGSLGDEKKGYKPGKFSTSKDDDVFYAKISSKDSSGGEVYIKFKGGKNLVNHNQLKNMPIDEILDGYSNIWDNDKRIAASALAQINTYAQEGENFVQNKGYSDTTWKINEFEIVTNMDELPKDTKQIININGNTSTLSPRKSEIKYNNVEAVTALSDIHFAVRMHQTVSSLKSTFSEGQKFNGIDYGTEGSYMTQPNSVVMSLFGYNDSPIVKKQMKGQIIIIDEAQNSYNSDLKAIVEQLGGDNVIVMLGDFHQNSKGDYFKDLSKDAQYMVETHRGTEDINIMNEINAFTQDALIKANAIGFYITDSDDFRRYDEVNPEWYNAKPNEYLMVVRKNDTRQNINDQYIEALGGMDAITDEKKGKTLQVMVVDVLSNKKLNRRGRKSEMPNSGLNMKGFKRSESGNYYYKQTDNSLQVFFPSSKTSNYDTDIKSACDTDKQMKKLAAGKDIEIFVPAFAITTEKESGKTVDNIILHDEVVNVDYDHLSEQNVKTYYDAFTRGSKKVYIPQRCPRLIGLTREDAKALMEGKPLNKGYIEKVDDKTSSEKFVLPVITLKKVGGISILDDIDDLLLAGGFTENDLSKAINVLRSYNLGSQTYGDYDMYGEVIDTSYMDILKKQVADQWDMNRTSIIERLEKKKAIGKDLEKKIMHIDNVVYGQTYKVPRISVNGGREYLNGSEGKENYIIWGNRKLKNKIVTIEDFRRQGMQIENGIQTDGAFFRPEFISKDGKIKMKFVEVNDSRRVARTTKGWIEKTLREDVNNINLQAEKMEVENIFNHQFGNRKISTAFVRSDIEGEGQENKFRYELRKFVDKHYSKLSDDDLYRKPMIGTTSTITSVVNEETINEEGAATDIEAEKKKALDAINKRRKAEGESPMTMAEYEELHPDAGRGMAVKQYTTTNEVDELEETAINRAYEALIGRIENKDDSDLDQLKADVNEFVQRVSNINDRETTAGLDTSEFTNDNLFINIESLDADMEDQMNCEG